ncbi:MAG: hypothetical protein WAN51_02410 [Alphaproteobacteria bacterium]
MMPLGGIMLRISGFLVALLLALSLSLPASARGRVFVGIGVGPVFPFYDPWYYPPYAYYPYPPPAYYPPPPPAYYPPTYAPAAPVAAAPSANCTRFTGDATSDDSGKPFYGVACMQADGKWHIVDN